VFPTNEFVQLAKVLNILQFLPKLRTQKRFEEFENSFNPEGGVDYIESFQILLVPFDKLGNATNSFLLSA
jgi:hypothetical protein